MSGLLNTIAWALCLAAGASVCHDLLSYTRRQDEWERRFPGQTYIRNYRRLNNKD